ncbi:hypothetical protein QL285_043045 [Trifolium repens]|nr:hypothetical protein QL285_043045 [Trifolium repens]
MASVSPSLRRRPGVVVDALFCRFFSGRFQGGLWCFRWFQGGLWCFWWWWWCVESSPPHHCHPPSFSAVVWVRSRYVSGVFFFSAEVRLGGVLKLSNVVVLAPAMVLVVAAPAKPFSGGCGGYSVLVAAWCWLLFKVLVSLCLLCGDPLLAVYVLRCVCFRLFSGVGSGVGVLLWC